LEYKLLGVDIPSRYEVKTGIGIDTIGIGKFDVELTPCLIITFIYLSNSVLLECNKTLMMLLR